MFDHIDHADAHAETAAALLSDFTRAGLSDLAREDDARFVFGNLHKASAADMRRECIAKGIARRAAMGAN